MSDSHDPQDEASELRREIESHLEMLEEDVMKNDPNSVSAARGATRQAEERFGNAVDHFRQGLAELERGSVRFGGLQWPWCLSHFLSPPVA